MAYWSWDLTQVLQRIEWKVDTVMANLAALQAAATQIQTDVSEAVTALQDLSSKVANGGGVSQEEIDAITTQLSGASQQLDDAVASNDPAPAPTPDPEPTPEPTPDPEPTPGN